jgi:hypothetical protein
MYLIKRALILVCSLAFLSLTACKDYYNDTIQWADSIPAGTDIDSFKTIQPAFAEIDWNKPDTFREYTTYRIIRIKGNRDMPKMSYSLAFIRNKYQGRWAHK